MTCKHWSLPSTRYGGKCELGLYKGRPTFGVCVKFCEKREQSDDPKAFDLLAAMERTRYKTNVLKIRDTGSVPTERWQYPGINGYVIMAPNWSALYPMIVDHYTANAQQPPSEQAVIDYCCSQLSVPCYDSDTHEPLVNRWLLGTPGKPPAGCCGK